MLFQNDFYAEDENGEVYLVDAKGNALTKRANNKSKLVCGGFDQELLGGVEGRGEVEEFGGDFSIAAVVVGV